MTLTLGQFIAAVIIFALLWAMGQFTAKAIVERQQRRQRRAWDTFHAYTPKPVPARRHASLREPFDQEQM